jgi:hypothetical protein
LAFRVFVFSLLRFHSILGSYIDYRVSPFIPPGSTKHTNHHNPSLNKGLEEHSLLGFLSADYIKILLDGVNQA